MARYLMTGEVAKISGMSAQSLDLLCQSGAIVPAIPSFGTGQQRRFSLSQTLAISLSRWLRKKGWTLRESGNVLQALLALSDERLANDFAAGKTHLMMVNGSCLPVLWPAEAIGASNPHVRDVILDAEAAGIEVKIVGIDVATAWADLCSKLNRKPGKRREATA